MTYTQPVYDRTLDDIENQTAKAFFNVADWMRIHRNTQIAGELMAFLLSVNISFDTVELPTITTIPTVAQLNTLLANIERVRVSTCLPEISGVAEITHNWQAGSSMSAPTYLNANEWERVLDMIYCSIARAVEYQPYCGVFSSGQARFYQHRFRQFPAWITSSIAPVRHARAGIAISGAGLTRANGFRRYE